MNVMTHSINTPRAGRMGTSMAAMHQGTLALLLLLLFLFALPWQPAYAATQAEANTPQILPEKFLRRWDTVTLFFNKATGPAQPGPEDHPERWVKLQPAHPGAYSWKDARTLQFRPAEPWPPLTRFHWSVNEQKHSLVTLMNAPIQTVPENQADSLGAVDRITLSFPEPVNVQALEKMVQIGYRPLPGVDESQTRWLNNQEFSVKVIERKSRADSASYVLMLRKPVPGGTKVLVRLKLSLDEKAHESFWDMSFSTADNFRMMRLGCSSNSFPITPEGVKYSRTQAIACNADYREIYLEFTTPPKKLNIVDARNLIRFTPTVSELKVSKRGKQIVLNGRFVPDTLYQVSLQPTSINDENGRALQGGAASEMYLYFPPKRAYLKWQTGHGIVERYGPQMLPLEGRGFERADIRIYPIDPLNTSFWPFPESPVTVDEDSRPPGPGEEPKPFVDTGYSINASQLSQQIKNLGSPAVSSILDLPLRKTNGASRFGLDIKPHLAKIAGQQQPGSYLVGLRLLNGSADRYWMRVQVTDLALTTVEERNGVRFAVTSLATGKPVAGADITIDAKLKQQQKVGQIMQGSTGADGTYFWRPPSHTGHQIRRIVVKQGKDTLVLDSSRPPNSYADNVWHNDGYNWLQWTQGDLKSRQEPSKLMCHVFSERPVYRPEEQVYLKGYVRTRRQGELEIFNGQGTLHINGPGDLTWNYKLELNKMGSFDHLFKEADLPSGEYQVRLEIDKFGSCGQIKFSKEAYRIPEFEVQLNTPDKVPLDREFKVGLSARYYAGGQVAARPVRWRVVQFPYTWVPSKRSGFVYSSDGRFSSQENFQARPALQREDKTDEHGAASLVLNPGQEATGQPRSYLVEATVTGADDQTVTSTRRVIALPSVILGMSLPRYLEQASTITPKIIAVGHDDELISGQLITVRLLKREWHSHLQASDFSQGEAKYVTDVVDKKISEQTLRSQAKVNELTLPLAGAGVYVVELETRDALGRAQVLTMDLFAGGSEAVTWSQPPADVFKVTPDKSSYTPGETAHLILESPFQQGQVLAITEAPDANRYQWLNVQGGKATFDLPIEKNYVPRLPVHFVLMRGRVPGVTPTAGQRMDLGKPATVASTAWVNVEPVEHQLQVTLHYPENARPGETVSVEIQLKDRKNAPLPGEVTLWLVDQAVLALGKEQRLDPIPDFISAVQSALSLHDTRNWTLGILPLQEIPGGDQGEKNDLFDRNTVRRDFRSVPYYNPSIIVGPDGKASVQIKLPDNLTLFQLRAKAVSGKDRFGVAKGVIAVRLPIIVQPALPRFVRPGDQFMAGALGRVVQGAGGEGRAEIKVQGITLEQAAQQTLNLVPNTPHKIQYKVSVPTPGYDTNGEPNLEHVSFAMAIERKADHAKDAFEVRLPLRPDRSPVIERSLQEFSKTVEIPEIKAPVRPGSVQRSVFIAQQPAVVRMAAGLNFLLEYPHGCTEQKISRADAYLALKKFNDRLAISNKRHSPDKAVKDVLAWLPNVVDGNGLVSYWPGNNGYVSLTAWTAEFLLEARDAGYHIDDTLLNKMLHALKAALRSDYANFINGEEYTERVMALQTLAAAQQLDEAYLAELARRSEFLNLESSADITRLLQASKNSSPATLQQLKTKLKNGVVMRLHQGRDVYGGLQEKTASRNGLILPSETRTLASLVRATSGKKDVAQQAWLDALINLGTDNGWGSTNANAAALKALAETLSNPDPAVKKQLNIQLGTEQRSIELNASKPFEQLHFANTAAGSIKITSNSDNKPLMARIETRYLPNQHGSEQAALAHGFVVNRELQRIHDNKQPADKLNLDQAGKTLTFNIGDVIEDHVELVSNRDYNHVAVIVPLAAGLEPLNPKLATASADAKPKGNLTLAPSYASYLDDQVVFYYDRLPKGTYQFYFRTRATIPGNYTQPPAKAELMYDETVYGNSPAARVKVE